MGISLGAGCLIEIHRLGLEQVAHIEPLDEFEMGGFTVRNSSGQIHDLDDEKIPRDNMSFWIEYEHGPACAHLADGPVYPRYDGQYFPRQTIHIDPENTQSETAASPGLPPFWLYSALYQICQILAVMGMMVSLMSVLYAAHYLA